MPGKISLFLLRPWWLSVGWVPEPLCRAPEEGGQTA